MIDVIPPKKKNVVMDATMLSSLMSCARFHDIRFNHRLVSLRGRSNSLEVGALIHKVLEVYYKHMINGFPRQTSIGNALAAGQLYIAGCPHCANVTDGSKPTCGHDVEEYPGLQNTPPNSEGFTTGYNFAMNTCEQYFEHYKNDALIPIATEHVKGEIIYEDDEIRVLWKAKFDLIVDTNQAGIVSMDHKTFKQDRDKTSLSNQFSGHCVLLKSRNVIVNKIGLQSSKKIVDRLSRELMSYSSDRLLEWQGEIVPYYAYKYIQFVESNYWPPDYTHCDNKYGMCPYKNVCEADRNMREEVLRSGFKIAPIWDPSNRGSDE